MRGGAAQRGTPGYNVLHGASYLAFFTKFSSHAIIIVDVSQRVIVISHLGLLMCGVGHPYLATY